MGKKPPLVIVPDRPATSVEPPSTLGEVGRNLWNRVMAEYSISDIGGLAMLEQACGALDRADRLRIEIERDGEVLRVRSGLKDHPALKHELANRAFVVKTLAKLGLDVEPVRSSVGRPPSSGVGWRP